MKLKKSEISNIFIILAILFQCCFFHLVPISSNMTYGMLFSAAIAYLLSMKDKTNVKYADKYLIRVFVFVFLLQGAYTIISGKQSLIDFVTVITPMLAIILFRPLLRMINRDNSVDRLIDIIVFITAVYMAVVIVNVIFRNATGQPIIKTEFYLYDSGYRNGRLRIMLISPFLLLAPICAFYKIIAEEGKKLKYIISFLVLVIGVFYVEQTRMNQIILVVCCALMYSTKIKNKRIKYIIYFLSFVLFIIGYLLGYSNDFLSSFSVTNQDYGVSTIYRMYEYTHALNNIKMSPLFGEGLISNYLQKVSYGGYSFSYNHTDIGLIGTLSYLGISAIPLVIMPLYRYIKKYFAINRKNRGASIYVLFVGIMVYFILTQITLSITDSVRIFAWPFVLALLEHCSNVLCRGDV